jgi:hypothetical protein
MYVIIDLLGDEETVEIGEPTTTKEAKDVHEQLVKWEDLVPEPALQILET